MPFDVWTLTVGLTLGVAAAAAGRPSGEDFFNASDGVSAGLMIAVGSHGVIFHLVAGAGGRQVRSRTRRDLFNVRVSSRKFAIAVGQGIVLRWDGIRWTPIVEEPVGVAYKRVWISQDRRLILYGTDMKGVNRVCPWIPGAEKQPFCRRFEAALRAVCGRGDEFVVVLANGELHRVNSAMIGKDGGFEPAFRPPSPLDLKAVWLPDPACDSRDGLPQAFALQADRSLAHFDGTAWRRGAGGPRSIRVPRRPAVHRPSSRRRR